MDEPIEDATEGFPSDDVEVTVPVQKPSDETPAPADANTPN